MSKAFTKESDDDDEPEKSEINIPHHKNYVTPAGFAAMQTEMRHLLTEEKPKLLTTIRWAAGNGDRSENGDYIYGKKRLREIYRRVRYLTKRLESAEIIDPARQQGLKQVFFGATVTYRENGKEIKKVKIVGVDEADIAKEKISWISPLAKTLLKSHIGDTVILRIANSNIDIEIINIEYLS